MTRIILALLALVFLACSSPVAQSPEGVAKVTQALCSGPPGLHVAGLVAAVTPVQQANDLINKMWGTWPKGPPTCPGASYCGTVVPNSCTQGQCDSGLCPGWTCRQYGLNYADDGLRVSATVSGPSLLENRWALQPMAGGLTTPEQAQLNGLRQAATAINDYWGCE